MRVPYLDLRRMQALAGDRAEEALLRAIDVSASEVRTPLMFEHQLMERARTDRKHVVLPEGGDDRILTAADILLRRGVADLTLLGDENTVRARASALGLDLRRFAVDLETRAHAPRVREDFLTGIRSGVNGTPTFFVNGVRHNGGYDLESLLAALTDAAA